MLARQQATAPPVEVSLDFVAATPETSATGRRFAERLVVDTSEKRPVYLLVGKNGSYIRLSASSFQLLRQVDQGARSRRSQPRSTGGATSRSRPAMSRPRTASWKTGSPRIEARAEPRRAVFWFRRQLLSGAVVSRTRAGPGPAFHPIAALGFLSVIAAAAYVLYQRGLHPQPGYLVSGYILFLTSMLAHELGHASACQRYGAQPSEIGFGFYLFYPAFYSNVSSAWELKRWQRMVVDLGGAYFQLIVAAGFAAAYLITGWEPLCLAIVLIIGACVFSLNPILKFDGYWLVADALGVTNLGQQPRRLFRHVADRLRGRPTVPLPWSPAVTAILALYTTISFGFWLWFLSIMLPVFGHRALQYPDLLVAAIRPLFDREPDMRLLRELLASTLMLTFMGLMWWRILRSLFDGVRARVSRGRRPGSAVTHASEG